MTVVANCEGAVGIGEACRVLEAGGTALDAVEAGVRLVEADPSVISVGLGGDPNLLGEMECDAAIMDGRTLKAGSVAALSGYVHAVSVARQVLERLPHVMLVGTGADRFATEVGLEAADLLTEGAQQRHENWLSERVTPSDRARWPDVELAPYAWESAKDYVGPHGTTAFLAQDRNGDIAAGTSTSGWARCYPGRVGDTPVIGAGLYADNRHGACACTHIGEMVLRCSTARSVVLYMKQGASAVEACREAMRDLDALQGGVIGPVVIHAIERDGRPCVFSSAELGRESTYFLWREGEPVACRSAAVIQGR